MTNGSGSESGSIYDEVILKEEEEDNGDSEIDDSEEDEWHGIGEDHELHENSKQKRSENPQREVHSGAPSKASTGTGTLDLLYTYIRV